MDEYVRIGVDYFKVAHKPLSSGDTSKTLLKWRQGAITTDKGSEFLKKIKKYDGYVSIPSNDNYQKEIKGFYNKYEETIHSFKKGLFPQTENFLKHIFGDQYELGLDYLTIIWRFPEEILPILCLVSSERKTGKTTFLNWLKLVFQGNMTINKNEDLRSRFNLDWTSKLIIAIDEVLLDRKEDSERLKNLSTSRSYKTESKGVDKIEDVFFGKFILCSNNEDNFIVIDKQEIRYWVRKLPTLSDSDENPNLLDDLSDELKYFMHHIKTRKIVSPKKTRMWFTKEQIYTDALSNLIKGSKTTLSKEITELIKDQFISFDVDELKFTSGDIVDLLGEAKIRTSKSEVAQALRSSFGLSDKNGSYTKYVNINYTNDGKIYVEKLPTKGRYFTFLKKDLEAD